jgi:hypothetical protein
MVYHRYTLLLMANTTQYRIHPKDQAPAGYNRRLRALYLELEDICQTYGIDVLKVTATQRGGDGSAHASPAPLGSREE